MSVQVQEVQKWLAKRGYCLDCGEPEVAVAVLKDGYHKNTHQCPECAGVEDLVERESGN